MGGLDACAHVGRTHQVMITSGERSSTTRHIDCCTPAHTAHHVIACITLYSWALAHSTLRVLRPPVCSCQGRCVMWCPVCHWGRQARQMAALLRSGAVLSARWRHLSLVRLPQKTVPAVSQTMVLPCRSAIRSHSNNCSSSCRDPPHTTQQHVLRVTMTMRSTARSVCHAQRCGRGSPLCCLAS
jgi:hypothetical protein